MSFPDLITSRLRIRAWRERDFEPHVMWEADPRVNEFLPFLHAPRTAEASREQIARFLATPAEKRQEWAKEWVRMEANRPYPWWAVEVTDIADVIGGIGLGAHTFESDFTPCVEIAWRFAPEYWGKGYATEAARAVLSYGFTTLGLNEIFSMSALGNKRSFALMERIGLRYVKDFLIPLLPEDHPLRPYALYKLTRAEWEDIGPGRYSPPKVVRAERHVVAGKPDQEHISTSLVERQNLTMRMSMRRFTRLTNAFSKKAENHRAAVALHFAHYNFVRLHQALRVTPAMAAGVENRVWDLQELVAQTSN